MVQKHKGVLLCFKCNTGLKAIYCGGSRYLKLNKYMYCPKCNRIYKIKQKII